MKLPRLPDWRHSVILACFFLVAVFSAFRVFGLYELGAYDLRLKLRPPIPVSNDIYIIEIADDTLHNLGRWPLPRDFHASLVGVLHEFGARAIVFDVLFSEPSQYDDGFAQAISQAGTVYLPEAFSMSGSWMANGVTAPLVPALAKAAAGTGHINVLVDADGKVRRLPLFIRYQDTVVPSVSFLAACGWLGVDPAALRLPAGAGPVALVSYPGTWKRSFKHVSYFDILQSYADLKNGKKPSFDLASLKGKACFIGLTATGTSDLRAMPLDTLYPMLGLQASVFNSVIQNAFIWDVGTASNVLIALAVFALSLFVSLKNTPLKAGLAGLILGGVLFGLSTAVFIARGICTDLFFPLVIVGLTYAGVMAYKFLREVRSRQLLEKELDIARTIQFSFLPEDIESFAGLSISADMQPAKFVAGDFYDIVPLDNYRLGVLIGDVSGKGVSASLIMAQTISFFRIFVRQHALPGAVLSRMNDELFGRFPGRFVTALYMVVDTAAGRARVASAAHAPILVARQGGAGIIEAELDADVPLGIMESVSYPETQFAFAGGDMLMVFTDGVSEARDKGAREFGVERVKPLLEQARDRGTTAQQALQSVQAALAAFTRKCPQHDDITLIVISAGAPEKGGHDG